MGDADDRLAGRDRGELLQDLVLGLGVEGAGRLVQDQDRGVAQQRPAMASRCRWPPEKRLPRSPTIVS